MDGFRERLLLKVLQNRERALALQLRRVRSEIISLEATLFELDNPDQSA